MIERSDKVQIDFNPLPPHGGRRVGVNATIYGNVFQSTPSAWRETGKKHSSKLSIVSFQSTPSAWRETGADMAAEKQFENISIHSLRMEGDMIRILDSALPPHFNPLPPHGGRLKQEKQLSNARQIFQSTPSAWRETEGI